MPSFIPATGITLHLVGVCVNRIGVLASTAGAMAVKPTPCHQRSGSAMNCFQVRPNARPAIKSGMTPPCSRTASSTTLDWAIQRRWAFKKRISAFALLQAILHSAARRTFERSAAHPQMIWAASKSPKISSDRWAFKTPSLRNVALTAPYMHDGSFKDLAAVVEYYDEGGHYSPNKSELIEPLQLTDDEKKSLIAFLNSLTGIKQ